MKINILVGTMTGTAQMCAQEMELALDGDEIQVVTHLMDKLEPSVFADREAVYLICTSTYGQGDVPDNAKAFYEALGAQKPDEKQLRRVEAIINSMTPEEREHAEVIDGSRRKRIARGSGTSVEDVNRLLKQYDEMRKMLKIVGQMTGEAVPEAPRKKKKKGPFSLMR